MWCSSNPGGLRPRRPLLPALRPRVRPSSPSRSSRRFPVPARLHPASAVLLQCPVLPVDPACPVLPVVPGGPVGRAHPAPPPHPAVHPGPSGGPQKRPGNRQVSPVGPSAAPAHERRAPRPEASSWSRDPPARAARTETPDSRDPPEPPCDLARDPDQHRGHRRVARDMVPPFPRDRPRAPVRRHPREPPSRRCLRSRPVLRPSSHRRPWRHRQHPRQPNAGRGARARHPLRPRQHRPVTPRGRLTSAPAGHGRTSHRTPPSMTNGSSATPQLCIPTSDAICATSCSVTESGADD